VGDRGAARNQEVEAGLSFRRFCTGARVHERARELAEKEGHHPALLTEWGRTTVTWWTHKIKGLHRNDFVMAAKADELYRRSNL
jgi:4a-hydroxytetrahydrobiopterin dehydratase